MHFFSYCNDLKNNQIFFADLKKITGGYMSCVPNTEERGFERREHSCVHV